MPPCPLPAPLVAPLPLVPPILRLLSGWLSHRFSSRRHVPSAGSIAWRAGTGWRITWGRCLLSGWLLCHLSSRRCIPCQRLRLSLRRCLSFLCSCASCPAGCCVAIHPVCQPQLHQHPVSKMQLELVQHRSQVVDHHRQHYVPPHPAPALVPPSNSVSKLPLCWWDTGLEGRAQQCRHCIARRGVVANVSVVDCAIEHPPRPSVRMRIVNCLEAMVNIILRWIRKDV